MMMMMMPLLWTIRIPVDRTASVHMHRNVQFTGQLICVTYFNDRKPLRKTNEREREEKEEERSN
jgi:hypothetical protein